MSKLILFDWRCTECDTKFEHLAQSSMKVMPCIRCELPAKRLISAPRIDLPGTDPDFPRAYDGWEKKNRKKVDEDKKFYKEHGTDKKHHSYGS